MDNRDKMTICKKTLCKLGNMTKKIREIRHLIKKNKPIAQNALQIYDFVICKNYQKVV